MVAEKASRSTASAPPAGTRVASAQAMIERPGTAELFFEQADGVSEGGAPQRVGANELAQVVGGLRRSSRDRFLLDQAHVHTALGELPGRLAAGEAGAYDCHVRHGDRVARFLARW